MNKQNSKIYIALPLEGSPFAISDFNHHTDSKTKSSNVCKNIQRVTGGFFETLPTFYQYMIHPLFCRECPRWQFVQNLLASGATLKTYVNENGIQEWSPNMATVCPMLMKSSGCPHLFGNILIEVTSKSMEKFEPDWRGTLPEAPLAEGANPYYGIESDDSESDDSDSE